MEARLQIIWDEGQEFKAMAINSVFNCLRGERKNRDGAGKAGTSRMGVLLKTNKENMLVF